MVEDPSDEAASPAEAPEGIAREKAACGPVRITRAEAAHVAGLARLRFTGAELDELAGQLAAVLDHAADVEALDVSDLVARAHPLDLADVTRPDEVRPSLDLDQVLDQAPAAESGRFRVPPILGEAP